MFKAQSFSLGGSVVHALTARYALYELKHGECNGRIWRFAVR